MFPAKRGLGVMATVLNYVPIQSEVYRQANLLKAMILAGLEDADLIVSVGVGSVIMSQYPDRFGPEGDLRVLISPKQLKTLPLTQRRGFISDSRRQAISVTLDSVPVELPAQANRKDLAKFYSAKWDATAGLLADVAVIPCTTPDIFEHASEEGYYLYRLTNVADGNIIWSKVKFAVAQGQKQFLHPVETWSEYRSLAIAHMRRFNVSMLKPMNPYHEMGTLVKFAKGFSISLDEDDIDGEVSYVFNGDGTDEGDWVDDESGESEDNVDFDTDEEDDDGPDVLGNSKKVAEKSFVAKKRVTASDSVDSDGIENVANTKSKKVPEKDSSSPVSAPVLTTVKKSTSKTEISEDKKDQKKKKKVVVEKEEFDSSDDDLGDSVVEDDWGDDV